MMKVQHRTRKMPHSEHVQHRHDVIVFLEQLCCLTVIVLKVQVFMLKKGRMIGFDALSFVQTVQYIIDSHGELPSIFLNQSWMPPPLSFLLTAAMASPLQNIVIASQIVSSLSMIIVFLALRSLLKHIGLLWSVPGFVLLYLTSALPIVIFLSMETTYDSLVFAWAMLALLASVQLFWNPPQQQKNFLRFSYTAFLVLSIVGGLQTKSSGLLFVTIPFCVLFARRNRRNLYRDFRAATFLSVVSLVLVLPLYYQRYYRETGSFFPHNMEWRIQGELAEKRTERDAHPFITLWNILRVPALAFQWDRARPEYSSFPDTVWYETWKRDTYYALAGPVSPFAREVSNFYIFFFSIPLLFGSALFFFRSDTDSPFQELGLLLFLVASLFALACIAFGYHFPVWGSAVFKTKYASPVVLWFTFCAAYCVQWLLTQPHNSLRIHRRIQYAAISLTIVFV